MATLPSGPLGPEDLAGINARLKELDVADREIERAARAGIDMSAQQAQSKKVREDLLKIKNAYFPGR